MGVPYFISGRREARDQTLRQKPIDQGSSGKHDPPLSRPPGGLYRRIRNLIGEPCMELPRTGLR